MSDGKNADVASNGDSDPVAPKSDQPFTDDQLREAWMEFATTRKMYHAEYHLLTQEYEIINHQIVVHLHNPVQETILDTLRADVTSYLREILKNSTIQVVGELKETTDKKLMYTNREKFDHLAEKNPAIKQLKDRLGLDPDF